MTFQRGVEAGVIVVGLLALTIFGPSYTAFFATGFALGCAWYDRWSQ